VFSGLDDDEAGMVWFDAHPDFDTPDEHGSGYFDGMGVATLAGQCWRRLASTVPGFRPIDLRRFLYCGIRDFEPGQSEKVAAARIAAVRGSTVHEIDFAKELENALGRVDAGRMAIHIDLDCLDTSVGRANEYAAPGGLDPGQLNDCLAAVCRKAKPLSLTIASFNPDLDGADAISPAGIASAVLVAKAALAASP
jgi:arginase